MISLSQPLNLITVLWRADNDKYWYLWKVCGTYIHTYTKVISPHKGGVTNAKEKENQNKHKTRISYEIGTPGATHHRATYHHAKHHQAMHHRSQI